MINITTKELEIENDLKRKIEFICDFCNTKPTIVILEILINQI